MVSSVEEGLDTAAGAVDIDHEGGKAVSAGHQVLFEGGESSVDVVLVRVLAVNEVYRKLKSSVN